MDYATILTALAASIATGVISALSTIAALRVHILYLKSELEVLQRRMCRAESRIGRSEISVAELQTKTKGL